LKYSRTYVYARTHEFQFVGRLAFEPDLRF
jgi:hypothetical protein